MEEKKGQMITKVGFIGYPISYTSSEHIMRVSEQFPGAIWLLGCHPDTTSIFYDQIAQQAVLCGHAVQYVDPQLNDYVAAERIPNHFDRLLALSDWLIVCWNNVARGAVYHAYRKLLGENRRRLQMLPYYYPRLPESELGRLRSAAYNRTTRGVL